MVRRKRCGCAEGQCFCVFASTDSVQVIGSPSNGFTPNAVLPLQVQDSPTLDLRLGGDTLAGTAFNPVDIQTFTADGIWTPPAGTAMVRITLIGGGAAGLDALSATSGLGGGGGSRLVGTLVGAQIPASATITVGMGGAAHGDFGGDSRFDGGSATTTFVAKGGVGLLDSSNEWSLGSQCPPSIPEGVTNIWSLAVLPDPSEPDRALWARPRPSPAEGWPYFTPGGGGSGEGHPRLSSQPYSSATAGMWAQAVKGGRDTPSDEMDTGGLSGNPDEDGVDNLITLIGSGGGGGSAASPGGAGGLYGGGGGGGGSDDADPGEGGPGAQGVVQIIAW